MYSCHSWTQNFEYMEQSKHLWQMSFRTTMIRLFSVVYKVFLFCHLLSLPSLCSDATALFKLHLSSFTIFSMQCYRSSSFIPLVDVFLEALTLCQFHCLQIKKTFFFNTNNLFFMLRKLLRRSELTTTSFTCFVHYTVIYNTENINSLNLSNEVCVLLQCQA